MARRDLPTDVQEQFFDFHWDRHRLWGEANLAPLERMPVRDLEIHLSLPIWPRFPGQETYDLSPREFLVEPGRFPHHQTQIAEADLSFPLTLMPNLKGHWVLIDGYHRLAKSVLEDRDQVSVKRVERSIIPKIRVSV